ncbi:MAG: ABC transporter permease [Thiogranum sp.]|nr:ABC transporter permease [Thiogranum sp.]
MIRLLHRIGDSSFGFLEQAGRLLLFLIRVLAKALRPPYCWRRVLRQIHFIGARSMLVILVAGLFTGMVLALQFYDTLVRFGSTSLLGSAVALAMIRELAPVLTALVVIGRAGSAICSELGIMRSDEQIDALECMAIDPYRYLLVPKLLACVISVPLLTSLFIMIGIGGGWFVAVVLFGLGEAAYFQGMYETVVMHDIYMGFTKSLVFGLLIVWITSAKGFFLHLERCGAYGAEGVSRVTTDAVVAASISVLCADYLISALVL